jgi:hypothetical protein
MAHPRSLPRVWSLRRRRDIKLESSPQGLGDEACAESAVIVVLRGRFRQLGEMPPCFGHL